jgi:hypothetical protein
VAELAVAITLGDRPVTSSTRLTELGGYHLVLSTVLLDRALPIELHSSYLGHYRTVTVATHLTLAPGTADTQVVEHAHDQLPVTHARERCVLDHLQVLVELAAEHGHVLAVHLPDRALV